MPKKKAPVKKKDVGKLKGRNSLDFLYTEEKNTSSTMAMMNKSQVENPALLRLKALEENKKKAAKTLGILSPVIPGMANWVPMGPLAIPDGQTYGGARVLVSGRVTAITPHPVSGNDIFIGTSRGGVWKTTDGGNNWKPMSDNADSLAIGALDISKSNSSILYAGTGEGNLQLYSTAYALNSAPGTYLGVGVLKSTDGGITWITQGTALLANYSFYRIAIHPTDPTKVFAATSKGLCRTLNGGTTWTNVTGGGLPAISASVISCCDVLIDMNDATYNTVYAAFWGDGIYKSINALAASPTWTKLTTGLPAGSTISRISLAQSASSPAKKYALIASNTDTFKGVYQTNNAAGTTWAQIVSTVINLYGAFTNNIAVDPTTPNTFYVSGVSLYKSTFSGGSWSTVEVGANIHPDSHCFGFNPTNNLVIYSGNDGGIYKSSNGGSTWTDSINKGLAILQFESIDQHPTSDALLLGGTQDNGTQQYRNSPVFYHADDGDGGYCAINPVTANTEISSYYGISFKRSTIGGKIGSWSNVSGGIVGSGLFYPPLAISPSSSRCAVGTDRVSINDNPGVSAWTGFALPGITGRVSAVSFATDTIVYAATTSGKVYRLDKSGAIWNVRTLNAAPLPAGWIWDICAFPGNPSKVLVVFANFGLAQHVWTGTVPAVGTATWVATSGGLSDIPMYAIAFESATTVYIGTDIGVFRSTNGGVAWSNFNQGMPNTAIYDLKYSGGLNLLRAGTHGRGLWEIKTNTVPSPACDLFVRDHAMHTGRGNSSASVVAAYEDPRQHINLNDNLYWWQCVDIKVDAPTNLGAYQLPIAAVDYLSFERTLEHDNPDKGNVNRVYVQVHNRGTSNATNVKVKILYAGASAGLPNLQANFWTAFPGDPTPGAWKPIGVTQTIPVVEPLKPVILEWDWNPPAAADTHSCMLVVMDSTSDPIPAANKVFNIGTLVPNEKRVGLKNLHLVNVVPGVISGIPFHFFDEFARVNQVFIDSRKLINAEIGLVFQNAVSQKLLEKKKFDGFKVAKMPDRNIELLKKQFIDKEFKASAIVAKDFDLYDFKNVFFISDIKAAALLDIPKAGVHAMVTVSMTGNVRGESVFSIVQTDKEKNITGGSTFVISAAGK